MNKQLSSLITGIRFATVKTVKKLLLPVALIVPQLSFALATWIGPATMDATAYNDPANWSPAGVPGTSETIIFATAVTITGNVPITSSNTITIQGTGDLMISSGVTLTTGNISVTGTSGSLTNFGTLSAGNVTYGNTAGGTITNNGSMSLNNLNVGASAVPGTFNNNGSLSVTNNIVVEEGTFSNNTSGTVTTNGINVRNGGAVLNSGTITSTGNTSTAQVNIASGGSFTNLSGGVLNIDIAIGNVYALDVSGDFTNDPGGHVNIGHSPYNTGAQGVIVRSSGNFSNNGMMTFQIDPSKCVIVDNHGSNGSFSTAPVLITSGSPCGIAVVGPLPLTLISFEGNVTDAGSAQLYWTINDNNHELLECNVLQSTDGTSFNKVATINADGHADYAVTIPQSIPVAYYKLDMVAKNGAHSYSQVISVKNTQQNADNGSLMVYPTIIDHSGPLHIAYTAAGASTIQVMIINTNGAKAATYTTTVNTGKNIISLTPGNLSQGTYFIRVFDSGTYSNAKMIIIQ